MWPFSQIPSHFPKGTGNYIPGVMDVMLGYEKDGIFMRVYYPTDEKINIQINHERWPPAMPDYKYIVGLSNVAMLPTFLINLAWLRSGKIRIPALYGAKIRTGRKLKLILFSHGLGALRSFYSAICVELASRGYIVAVLEHRDESACYTYYYDSADAAKRDERTNIPFRTVSLGKGHLDVRKEQVNYRAAEMHRAYEFFTSVNAGTVPHNVMDDVSKDKVAFSLNDLVGCIDTENISVAGHSFGAATCLLALTKEKNLKFGILLDPWMFPIKGMQLERKIDQPLLFINTQTFHIDSNVRAMSQFWDETSGNRHMYTIIKSTHENQTDSVLIAGYWLNWFMKKIDPCLALKINNYLILKHLEEVEGAQRSKDVEQFLDNNTHHYELGLTKPWA